jgi:hypothetical protein
LQRRFLAVAGGSVTVLAVVLLMMSGPRFIEALSPVPVDDDAVRPLPLNPNVSVRVAFGTLGSKPPKPNPDAQRLTRYSYGADLAVDGINGVVYAITVRVPNRSWRGLRPGMDQRTAEGTLALLGTAEEAELTNPTSRVIGGFVVFPSLDSRPRRTLRTEIRPPNGCFDVLVDLRPQSIGLVQDGDQRYAAVARDGDPFIWVVTQVRIVSRSMSGPYAPPRAC